MKVNQIISTLLIIAFIVGVLFVTVLYIPNWGNNLSSQLELSNIKQVDTIDTAVTSLVVAVGLVAILGLAAIFMLLLGVRNRIDVVYVHSNHKSNMQNSLSEDNNNLYESENYKLLSPEFLTKLRHLIENNQANRKIMYEKVLSEICKALDAVQGIIYLYQEKPEDLPILEAVASYAYYSIDGKLPSYHVGEGLVGQVAKNIETTNVRAVPEGYITTISGLGKTTPANLILQPIFIENEQDTGTGIIGVLEIASFSPFEKYQEQFLKEVSQLLARESQQYKK